MQILPAFEADGLPGEEELTRVSKELAEHVTALSQAPAGEAYDGPVLFEAPAAAQMFGQLLGDNLKLLRKPISDPGRVPRLVSSELENKRGIAHFAGVDRRGGRFDADQVRGHTLLGHYLYDVEGVAPQPSRWWKREF